MSRRTAIVIGAGPAGLTAAWEMLDRTDVVPLVLEASDQVGGISRTAVYRGNRMDIGGHRFFSKSDVVMDWWQNILPLQGAPARDDRTLGRDVPLAETCQQRVLGEPEARTVPAPDPEQADDVMLVRSRLSRIYYLGRFFDYPISLKARTLTNLGARRVGRIGVSYLRARTMPIREEASLEDFLINRFGRELYRTFFEDYTEKVWGVPCHDIPPEWGAQRIKGLSITGAVKHALKQTIARDRSVEQKDTETSLIEQFLYPKLGPGQLWERVADQVTATGGEVRFHRRVTGVTLDGGRVKAVIAEDPRTGETEAFEADHVVSTMPLRALVRGMSDAVPQPVRDVAAGLPYRDFITVGVLASELQLRNETDRPTVNDIVPDNWIYIQDRGVRLGRLQVFNNWSPYLVADPDTVWLGLEYFCDESDDLWRRPDEGVAQLAVEELEQIGVIDRRHVLDTTVIRVPRTYPAYFGTYDSFDVVRAWLDRIDNLVPVGRNGMHRYNNQDHSMLSAMVAVDGIAAGHVDREALWNVNAEDEYHESKS